jgi:sugar lactone lactonase YvrE
MAAERKKHRWMMSEVGNVVRVSRKGVFRAKVLLPLAAAIAAAAGCGTDKPDPCRSGAICTWAGTGDKAFDGDGNDRLATSMFWPTDVTAAADGTMFVLDWQNHRVRRITARGTFETVLGTDDIGDGPDEGSERTPPGVAGTACHLNHPTDVALAPDGSLIVAAWHNHKVRRLDLGTGMVEVVSGAGPGFTGDGKPALGALLNQPKSIAVEPSGAVYVLDARNFRIRRITPGSEPTIETVAGGAPAGFAGDGASPLEARFAFQKPTDNPEPGGGLALDPQGRLYVVDTENHRIRRIDFTASLVETVAGNGTAGFAGDGGPATEAALNYPRDVAIGPDGRVFIADTDNHRVRVVDPSTGVISTAAGNGEAAFGGDGGNPVAASLQRPFGISVDGDGNLFIADTFNNRIRKVTP